MNVCVAKCELPVLLSKAEIRKRREKNRAVNQPSSAEAASLLAEIVGHSWQYDSKKECRGK
jgi:hypothetical protein